MKHGDHAPLCRCSWPGDDPLYLQYHDEEWAVPCFDDTKLFESIILDGAQAGLSWITVLRKREYYRLLFDDFDAGKIACYDEAKIQALLGDARIIRNRLKIRSVVTNAQAFLELKAKHGSFSDFVWDFVDGRPIQNAWSDDSRLPGSTAESEALSRALKQAGFSFVGATICYAFMQAVGMVNDHITDCFRYEQVQAMAENRRLPV